MIDLYFGWIYNSTSFAGMAELVDALGLGPSSESCAGSSPVTRTNIGVS